MKIRFIRIVAALAIAMYFLIGTVGNTLAQAPSPEDHGGSRGPQRVDPAQPYQNEDGVWMAPESGAAAMRRQAITPLSAGGPDDSGYTWDDSIPLSWIDATTGGSVVSMSGNTSGLKTGPIGLPFAFKYYANTYSSLYIAASGYLGFVDAGSWPWQPRIPSAALPNNIIAPYATPLNLAASGSVNRIYYKSGGTAPNRYFVVEWYQVKYNDETYTFEVILLENGDIVFQYLQMNNNVKYLCGASGIEDTTGTDGLAYVNFCDVPAANKAVRFYRPAPSARLGLTPQTQGRFAQAAEWVTFPLTFRNTGMMGTDVYDISITYPWPATIFLNDKTTPLVDTDADGFIDTGPIAQGNSLNAFVTFQMPLSGNVGDSYIASIHASSSLNPGISKSATFNIAIPASFTQVFRDSADDAMSISIIQPGKEDVRKASADGINGNISPLPGVSHPGNNPSIVAKADGYVYMWEVNSLSNASSKTHIEYAFLDKNGNVTRGPIILTDNNLPPYYVYDSSPTMDVAPNGQIGVAWVRRLWNSSTGKAQNNVYFTVLNPSGAMAQGVVNLTNITSWGPMGIGVPIYNAPHLIATSDNRFMVVWEQELITPTGNINDLYYLVRDSNNLPVKALTRFTNDTAGYDQSYEDPTLTLLSNNRVFMAWYQRVDNYYTDAFAVFDSSGNVTRAPTDFNLVAWDVDAVQLSTGQIFIAGRAWYNKYIIIYAMLDGTSFAPIAWNIYLANPNSRSGDSYASVTADANGHGIITWTEYDWIDRTNLYYALISNNGGVVTQPMILRSSQAVDPNIETSFNGYGNTTNKLVTPTSPDTDLRASAPSLAGGKPGGTASIPVWVSNYGTARATSVVLTATWDNNLTYVGAEPAPTSVAGNVATWDLIDLSFQGSGKITLTVSLPSTTIGTLYPITWSAASTGPEANPADNTTLTNIMEAVQLFNPLISR